MTVAYISKALGKDPVQIAWGANGINSWR